MQVTIYRERLQYTIYSIKGNIAIHNLKFTKKHCSTQFTIYIETLQYTISIGKQCSTQFTVYRDTLQYTIYRIQGNITIHNLQYTGKHCSKQLTVYKETLQYTI